MASLDMAKLQENCDVFYRQMRGQSLEMAQNTIANVSVALAKDYAEGKETPLGEPVDMIVSAIREVAHRIKN